MVQKIYQVYEIVSPKSGVWSPILQITDSPRDFVLHHFPVELKLYPLFNTFAAFSEFIFATFLAL